MCEFCVKHGEGKKWYLNAKNYSNDLLSDIRRKLFAEDLFYWINRSYNRYFNLMKKFPLNMPIIGPSLRALIKGIFINQHWGQVVPIEDIEEILSMTNSITRVPCVCRKTTTGKEIRSCFLVSLNPKEMGIADIIDQSFWGGPDIARFENFTKEATLTFMREAETKGAIHTIWTVGTPFIGAICTCDDTGCIPMKAYREVTPLFFRSEYVIEIENGKCTSCKACIKICPFGALEYDAVNKEVKIDYMKCYGCGICRVVCKQNALKLIDRRKRKLVRDLWY